MIKYLLAFVLVSVWRFTESPKVESPEPITICYSGTPLEGMAAFSLDPVFMAMHPSLQPIDFVASGENVVFKTPDGKTAGGYFLKADVASDKWLFVYQEWWGLNDYIRKESERFYDDFGGGVNVLAVDLYDGKQATTAEEAGKLVRGVDEARLENIIKGAYSFAGDKATVAHVGWCFGGSWSLKGALLGGKSTAGTVMYYGMPVKEIDKLKTLNGDVLGLFATEQYISKEIIEEFAKNMKAAGKRLEYKIYEAPHAFANPSNPKYDADAAKDAYARTLTYLRERLDV